MINHRNILFRFLVLDRCSRSLLLLAVLLMKRELDIYDCVNCPWQGKLKLCAPTFSNNLILDGHREKHRV